MASLLAPLMEAMFVETNPVPAKAALACLGLGTANVRLPLSPAEPETWTRVQSALARVQSARRGALAGLPATAVPHDPAALAS